MEKLNQDVAKSIEMVNFVSVPFFETKFSLFSFQPLFSKLNGLRFRFDPPNKLDHFIVKKNIF